MARLVWIVVGMALMAVAFEAGEHDWRPFESHYCKIFGWLSKARCK